MIAYNIKLIRYLPFAWSIYSIIFGLMIAYRLWMLHRLDLWFLWVGMVLAVALFCSSILFRKFHVARIIHIITIAVVGLWAGDVCAFYLFRGHYGSSFFFALISFLFSLSSVCYYLSKVAPKPRT